MIKLPNNSEVLKPQMTRLQDQAHNETANALIDFNTPGIIERPTYASPGTPLTALQSANFSITMTSGSGNTQVDIGLIPAGSASTATGGVAITSAGRHIRITANQTYIVADPADPDASLRYDANTGWTPARADDPTITASYATTDPDGDYIYRNSGNTEIPLILASGGSTITNYFWIDYLGTSRSDIVAEDETAEHLLWYSDVGDGYSIYITTDSATIPPPNHPTAIYIGSIDVGDVAGDPDTISYADRVYSLRLASTVEANIGSSANATTVYEDGLDITMQEHVRARGTGVLGPLNPHGLSAGDLGIQNSVTLLVDASGTTNLTTAEGIIFVDAATASGDVALTLPVAGITPGVASTLGLQYDIKRIDTDDSRTVTVAVAAGPGTIDGATSITVPATQARKIVCDGTDWWVVGTKNGAWTEVPFAQTNFQDPHNLVVALDNTNPTYKVTVTADGLNVAGLRLSSVAVSASIVSSGAGGLDTGSEAASTWYSIWVIYNQTTATTSALLSTSATAPTMPSGYTFKRLVGWVRNNASSNFERIDNVELHFNDSGDVSVQDFLVADLSQDNAWHTLSLSSRVPPSAKSVLIHVSLETTSSTQIGFGMRKLGNTYSHNVAWIMTQLADKEIHGTLLVSLDTNRNVEYYCANAGGTQIYQLTIVGWYH